MASLLLLSACKHNSPNSLIHGQPPQSKRAFTVKASVSELDDSYCLSVVLIETRGATGADVDRGAYDQLTFPNLCVSKSDGAEHVMSLSTKTAAAMDKELPFKTTPLTQGEPGIEVRFRVEAETGEHAPVADYSITYRLPESQREHRWTGRDVLPLEQ